MSWKSQARIYAGAVGYLGLATWTLPRDPYRRHQDGKLHVQLVPVRPTRCPPANG